MRTRLQDAAVGDWFAAGTREDCFEIVAIDHEAAEIAVQYYDGTIGEIDFSSWLLLEARAIQTPKDSAGAFDTDHDDLDGAPTPLLSRGDVVDNLDQLLY